MNALTVISQDANVEAYRASTNAAEICKGIVVATAKSIQGRKYVQVEGWQAIAVAHGCTASARDVERIDGGVRAVGEIRRMSDGVVIAVAEGFVGEDEPVWFGGPDPRGKMHPRRADYAIRAMAQTRAISRACRSAFAHVVVMMNAGLATTPAEEVEGGGFDDRPQPAKPQQARSADVLVSQDQRRQLMVLGTAKNVDTRKLCAAMGVQSIPQLPASKYDAAVAWINALPSPKPAEPEQPVAEMLDDEIPY